MIGADFRPVGHKVEFAIRMAEAAEGADSTRPRIGRAMTNLQTALMQRLARRPISQVEIDRVIALIDEAASAIEKV